MQLNKLIGDCMTKIMLLNEVTGDWYMIQLMALNKLTGDWCMTQIMLPNKLTAGEWTQINLLNYVQLCYMI